MLALSFVTLHWTFIIIVSFLSDFDLTTRDGASSAEIERNPGFFLGVIFHHLLQEQIRFV